jgi:sulfite exporter TauE/SafE
MDIIYLTAITVGFLGSFHCIGMCGPLAMALPHSGNSTSALVFGRLLYNLGRILTYSIIGFVFGSLGSVFSFRGWQSNASILSGILIILFVLFSNDFLAKKINIKLVNVSVGLKKYFNVFLKRNSYSSLFSIGLLNGVLPCGFVYLALAGAAATGSILGGGMYMFLFGLGTLPMMFILSLSGSFVSQKVRTVINKFSPIIAIGLALFLINRGATLRSEKADCCHKPSHVTSLK